MFTGIVATTAEVVAISGTQQLRTHILRFSPPMLEGLTIGASVAHNGCCLTVTRIDGDMVSFDLMQTTLELTNLGGLRLGAWVNVERAACFGAEIGGHAMSGHIMATATVDEVIASNENRRIWLQAPAMLARYLFTKGYVGVDGCSLTIAEVVGARFCVDLIPETLARTNLSERQQGDRINLEVDPQTQAIVDTVERVLAQRVG